MSWLPISRRPNSPSFLATRAVGPDRVHFHINVALVKTGSDYLLIDAGCGGTWEPTAGKLADSLEAAGISPEEIGTVVLTHAHPDHLWGLIDDLDNSLRYPRAHYLVAARELDFWTLGEAAKLSGPIEGIRRRPARFKAIAARTTGIQPGHEIAPGIVAIDTAGHMPGHISLLIASGSQQLLVTADAIQNAHVSLAHPDWQPRADMDGAKAAISRRRLLDMAATDKLDVLCYHIPFPASAASSATARPSAGSLNPDVCKVLLRKRAAARARPGTPRAPFFLKRHGLSNRRAQYAPDQVP